MIEVGGVISTTGTSIQFGVDLKQEKYEEAVIRLGIEAATMGASQGLQKVVNSTNLENVAKKVLNSQVEAVTETAKIGVKEKLKEVKEE